MTFIYTLSNPTTGEVRYIGKTNNCYQRYRHHLVSSANPKSHKRNWINSLKKKNLKPILEIIDEVSDTEWQFWEHYWIIQFKAWGFNIVNHTNGGEGLTMGNETSFKKGFTPWNKNKPGYNTSKKGQSIPQEVKDKISKTLEGHSYTPTRKVLQLNKITMKQINSFSSIQEASDKTDILYSSICNALSGRSKTAGGYIWH